MSLTGLLGYNSDSDNDSTDFLDNKIHDNSNDLVHVTGNSVRAEPSREETTEANTEFALTGNFPDLLYIHEIPKVPEVKPKNETVERILQYLQMKERGFDITENIKSKKEFQNPQILQKIVEHFGIDEIGSNYPTALFDPHGYSQDDYHDGLQAARRSATPTAPTTATVNLPSAPQLATAISAAQRYIQGLPSSQAQGVPQRQTSTNPGQAIDDMLVEPSVASNVANSNEATTYTGKKRPSRWGQQ